MTRTFKEMPYFTKQWHDLGFDDDALRGLQNIIMLDFAVYETVYLITAYKKADKENLTQEERNDIKQMVSRLKSYEREVHKHDSV